VSHGVDLLHGWKHDLVGLCLFLLAVTLALSADRLLGFFLAPIEKDWEGFEAPKTWLARVWNWFAVLGRPSEIDTTEEAALMGGPSNTEESTDQQPTDKPLPRAISIAWSGVFLLAGMTSIYVMSTLSAGETSGTDFQTPEFANRLAAESLSPVDDWRFVQYGDEHAERLFAQSSRLWTYDNGSDVAVFSVNFSFPDWHPLDVCYTALGWDLISGSVLQRQDRGEGARYLQSRFRKGDQHGLLFYCYVDTDGEPFDPPEAVSATESIRRRFQTGQHTLYQIQLWVTSDRPLDDRESEFALRLFETLRSQLVAIVKGGVSGEAAIGGVRADTVKHSHDPVDEPEPSRVEQALRGYDT
jgi:hypothetical protein